MITLNNYFFKFLFIFLFSFFLIFIGLKIFAPVLNSNSITLELPLKSINIYPSNPPLWHILKKIFIISYAYISVLIAILLSSLFFHLIFSKKTKKNTKFYQTKNSSLQILAGYDYINNLPIYINEYGLYQNVLITGTIGTGKTSSAMYPFTEQLIAYMANIKNQKIGMLILDVKGNYYSKVLEYAQKHHRQNDVIVIELNGKYKYNPLHKPSLRPSVIANQLKSILLLFSPNNSESYWLDKAEEVLRESIKLCRLYNSGYVTFKEIHQLVTQENYYLSKIEETRRLFLNGKYQKEDLYDLLSCINFFNEEFFSLDNRTLNILKSEITRITNCFISDYSVQNTFCTNKENLNFLRLYRFN